MEKPRRTLIRRTAEEIENDLILLRDKASDATSMSELSRITGITISKIRQTLKGHPRIEKQIIYILANNKAAKQHPNAEKSTNAMDGKQLESTTHTEEVQHISANVTPSDVSDKVFVIDASITNTENVVERIKSLIESGGKIILTSITIRELESLQKKNSDLTGKDARNILAMAVEDEEHFKCVQIDEAISDDHDTCILRYCSGKPNLTLLTSDKGMTLRARADGTSVQYLKKLPCVNAPYHQTSSYVPTNTNIQNTDTIVHNATNFNYNDSLVTLPIETEKVNGYLGIKTFHTNYYSVRVISKIRGNTQYNGNEPCELKVHDTVIYIDRTMTLYEYRIIRLSNTNNARLISKKHIQGNARHIQCYSDFVHAFMKRLNIK